HGSFVDLRLLLADLQSNGGRHEAHGWHGALLERDGSLFGSRKAWQAYTVRNFGVHTDIRLRCPLSRRGGVGNSNTEVAYMLSARSSMVELAPRRGRGNTNCFLYRSNRLDDQRR